MALEQNDIRYDVDIDLQDSLREIDKLRQKLKSFSDDLAIDATRVQRQMSKAAQDYVNYIRKLEHEMRQLKSAGKDVTSHEARLNQIRNRQRSAVGAVLGENAQGDDKSRAMRSVLQREINEMRSTTRELVGKYFDELNQSYLRQVRRSLTNIQNEERLARNRMQDRNYRAEYGDAAFGFMKQRERRQLNGGANQFASQFGILTNYAMVGGVYGAGFQLGSFIIQLDKEFKQFQAITATTNTTMAQMEDRLLSVAEKTKFTALEISQASTLLGQAGMSAAEVGEAIEPISLLATAAGTDLKNAVDVVTSALNIFNLQTNEAGHLADVFTAALNESKLTLDQLTLALQYAGNTAATAGVSYNELTAAVGALANAGIRSGSTMGTGLRQLLVDLISPSKNLRSELDRLGLTVEDINLETNGLSGVMANLKLAGFDTASAFEGLEVRAAAAYTALSNNLDTMAQLRQSFILSNAAAQANETQMESLANTAAKFGSNLGALVYTAFKPFLEMVQNIVNVSADMLAILRSNETVVKAVGTAFAVLTTAIVVARLGKLAMGLLAIGAAGTTASRGVWALTAAIRANPLLMGATVIIAGLQLMSSYADTAGRVATALDALKAQQEEYQASVDHTTDRIAALNTAMEDLIKKQRSLDAEGSDMLRKTKIMEVVATFQELTGEIDSSTASIADLIKAMQNLSNEMAASLPDQFGLLVDQIDKRIGILNEAATKQATGQGRLIAGWAASTRFGNGGAIESTDSPVFNEDVAKTFGKDIAEAFLAITNQIDPLSLSGQRAQALQTILTRAIYSTERDLKPLQARTGLLGGDLNDDERARLKELEGNLAFLKSLGEAFAPMSKYLVEMRSLELDREIQSSKQAEKAFETTTGFQNASGLFNDAQKMLTERVADLTRADLPIEETHAAFEAIKAELAARIGRMNEELEAGADELRASKEGFDEKTIAAAVQGAKARQAELTAAVNKSSKGSLEDFQKLQVYLLEQEQDNVKKQIAAAQKQLGEAQNERQVDLIENQLYELDSKLAKLESETFDLDKHKDVGENSTDLELAKRKLRDAQKLRRDDLITNVIDKRADLADEANKLYTDDLEDQLKNVQNEMKDLARSIDNNSTVDFIRTTKEKLDELNRKARELAGQIAGISVSNDFGAFTVGGLPTASAGDVQRRIIAAANKAGIPPQIALALASFESGFNPSAKNPNSSAAGLFQNTDANWASHGLRPGDRSSVDMQIFAGIQDMLRTQKALGTTQLSFRDYYGSHLLGQAGYKSVMRSPNANAVQLLGASAVAGNGGNPNQTAQEFLDMVVRKASAHLDKVKDFVQRPMDAAESAMETQTDLLTEGATDAVRDAGERIKKNQIKGAVTLLDSQAKAIEAQINTLMVQSSKAQDPAAIQSIIDQVRSKWADMMEKEIEAFTTENQGADDFKERLASLTEELNAGLSGKIVTLLDRYQASIENLQYQPLLNAEAQLSAAQNPLYAHKYSEGDVQDLQRNVQLQQRAATMERLNQLEQLHTFIIQQVSAAEQQYGANSQMVQALKERQYSVEQRLNDVRRDTSADTEAAAKSELTLADAIQAANRAWMQRNGLMDAQGRMTTVAEQVGEAWGQVLDGISGSLNQLFMDLAEGSMTAEEAFKKFGLSVIQMLMQMIAKAMVFNMLQGLMGGEGGSGGVGVLGKLLGMLFGGGAATGTYIAGIKRAAAGEFVTGNAPFRDGQLRSVMPGEMILRASAVNQIGRDALEKVNALGNRRIAAGMPSLPAPAQPDGRPINIWAVLPEEKPQMGPNDVVAVISDDIRRRGTTRSLIKAISAGKL